jgi:hypothetical protein
MDELFTVEEAFGLLKMKRSKFYQQVRAGKIALLHDGRRTLVSGTEIARYQGTLQGTPAAEDDAWGDWQVAADGTKYRAPRLLVPTSKRFPS